jgi:hypothetical protein
MVRFLLTTLVMLAMSCGERDERDGNKNDVVTGTWVRKYENCSYKSDCNCRDTISFHSNGVFSGYETCLINGSDKSGSYGGVYEIRGNWLMMLYYDSREEYYSYLTIDKNKMGLVVGNNVRTYFRSDYN